MRRLLPLVTLLLGGCLFQNVSAEERLRDAVVGLNDEARWYRLDLAAQRVAAPFQGIFRATHYAWGRSIQIADSEIVHVEVAGEDRDQATSWVAIRWYRPNSLYLVDSTLKQEWRKVPGGYVLTAETVVDGSEDLLVLPAESDDPGEEEPAADAAASATDLDADAPTSSRTPSATPTRHLAAR